MVRSAFSNNTEAAKIQTVYDSMETLRLDGRISSGEKSQAAYQKRSRFGVDALAALSSKHHRDFAA